jgi:hypothetical protein
MNGGSNNGWIELMIFATKYRGGDLIQGHLGIFTQKVRKIKDTMFFESKKKNGLEWVPLELPNDKLLLHVNVPYTELIQHYNWHVKLIEDIENEPRDRYALHNIRD